MRYDVEEAELVVFDDDGVRHRGRPDGYPVAGAVPIAGSADAIVLLVYSAKGAPRWFANLLRVRSDGTILWRAGPPRQDPDLDDAWVAFRLGDRGRLSASSWSCYRCELDVESGEILSTEFTK